MENEGLECHYIMHKLGVFFISFVTTSSLTLFPLVVQYRKSSKITFYGLSLREFFVSKCLALLK